METKPPQYQPGQHLLPPSPPPSPPKPRPRSRVKKHHHRDPFFDLDDASATSNPSSPLTSSPPPSQENAQQEPLLVRIILTPVLFTSFLISLFLVNRSDRIRRIRRSNTSSRANSSSSGSSLFARYLSPWSWLNLDPEPYQDDDGDRSDDGLNKRKQRRDSQHAEIDAVLEPMEEDMRNRREAKEKKAKVRSWHLRKKVGKVSRLEIDDAFAMRGRVIVVIVAVWVMAVYAIWRVVIWLAALALYLIGGKR
ncbi:hypothetical protein DM02DRAFT_67328 [Periconia macrospinosa]|uniref:Uncharacterized protein n=1 Tax=Periconia macrospinosa TaxID=97972 RepID=A0A2V1DHZ3_9PLEO|nr:hypothetical protein DM02DRAFT_67328 [Periconia macrospinosa]